MLTATRRNHGLRGRSVAGGERRAAAYVSWTRSSASAASPVRLRARRASQGASARRVATSAGIHLDHAAERETFDERSAQPIAPQARPCGGVDCSMPLKRMDNIGIVVEDLGG